MSLGSKPARHTIVAVRLPWGPRARGAPSRTWVAFGVLLGAGVAVRAYAVVAYSPAMLSDQAHDGGGYIGAARRGLSWADQEPSGYPLFLRVAHAISRELAFTISVQHALGLATGLLLFMTVRRLAGPPWLGLVPAAIVWLGGDQLFLEHAPLTESLFTLLVAGTAYCGIRSLEGGWVWPAATCALAATLLSVRSVGLLMPVVVLVWLAASRWRTRLPLRRSVAAGLAAAMLVTGAYGALRHHVNGRWSVVSPAAGWILYARAAEFADCREFTPPPGTAALCDPTPKSRRKGPGYYLWLGGPAHAAFGYPVSHDRELGAFARAAIVHQPLDYLGVTGTDLVRYVSPDFGPPREQDFAGPQSIRFQAGRPGLDERVRREAGAYYGPVHRQSDGAAEGLRDYQSVMRLSGWELAILLALGIAGAAIASGRVRWGLILLLAVGLELLLVPPLTHGEWRYAVPAEGPVAAAGAIGAWLLARGRLSAAS
jgi:hypothetical protein